MAEVSLPQIQQRLNSAPKYHPYSAETFADWAVEAGDIVSISRDGQAMSVPVHSSNLVWKGKQKISLNAGGNKEREPIAIMSKKKYGKSGYGINEQKGLYREFHSENGNMHSYLEMTESHLITRFEDEENGLFAQFEDTASQRLATFDDTANNLFSTFEDTASHRFSTFTDESNGLLSTFEDTASHRFAAFDDAANGLYSTFEDTASHRLATFDDTANGKFSTFEDTASRRFSSFDDTANGLYSTFEDTASRRLSAFEDTAHGLTSEIEQTASYWRSRYQDTEGYVGTLEQTASYWRVMYSDAMGNASAIEQTASYWRSAYEDAQENNSSIEQTASYWRSTYESALGYNSSIEQTASYWRSTYTDATGLLSAIEQTASYWQAAYNDSQNGWRSVVTQTASQWKAALSDVLDSNGRVTAASIATQINSQGQAGVSISGAWVNIDGTTKLNEVLSINKAYLHVLKKAVFDEEVDFGTSVKIRVQNNDYVLNGNELSKIIKDASVSNNELTLTRIDGTTVNFSKAVTLSGSWSNGALAVTPSPNVGSAYERTLAAGTVSWDGNTATVPVNATFGPHGEYSESTGWNVYVNASARYEAGQTAAGLTINASAKTVDRATASSTKSVSISAAVQLTYDSSTHKYSASAQSKAGTTQMGTASATSGTEAYEAGQTAAGLTINASAKTVDRATASATKSLSISAAVQLTYDSSTHKYTADAQSKAGTTQMGTASATSGTEAYEAGQTAAGLTINASAKTVDRATASATKSLSISAAVQLTYDSSTHKYSASAQSKAGTTQMGTASATSGTEAYEAGQTAAGLTINASAKTVDRATASSTKSLSISAAVQLTYDSNTHKYTASAQSKAGSTQMGTASATSGTEAYNAGYDTSTGRMYFDGQGSTKTYMKIGYPVSSDRTKQEIGYLHLVQSGTDMFLVYSSSTATPAASNSVCRAKIAVISTHNPGVSLSTIGYEPGYTPISGINLPSSGTNQWCVATATCGGHSAQYKFSINGTAVYNAGYDTSTSRMYFDGQGSTKTYMKIGYPVSSNRTKQEIGYLHLVQSGYSMYLIYSSTTDTPGASDATCRAKVSVSRGTRRGLVCTGKTFQNNTWVYTFRYTISNSSLYSANNTYYFYE